MQAYEVLRVHEDVIYLKEERTKQYVVEREYKNLISKEELIRRIIKKHCNNND